MITMIAVISDAQWNAIPPAGRIALLCFIFLATLGASIGFHILWARRNEPDVRAQIEEIRPFMRSPRVGTFLVVALIADAALLMMVILLVREWLGH